MSPKERVVVCFLAILIIIGVVYFVITDKSDRIVYSPSWITSAVYQPPINVPIVGLWMNESGQPEIAATVRKYSKYYEYNALHPEGPLSLLYNTDPMWWVSFPGGAK
jgi:hypothetical protein